MTEQQPEDIATFDPLNELGQRKSRLDLALEMRERSEAIVAEINAEIEEAMGPAPLCVHCDHRADDYLASVPEVTWSHEGLGQVDGLAANGKQEYVEDGLRKAAEIMRLVRSAFEQKVGPALWGPAEYEPEQAVLASLLYGDIASEYALYEHAALEVVGLPRSVGMSSAARERA